jgi:hypothetical protein
MVCSSSECCEYLAEVFFQEVSGDFPAILARLTVKPLGAMGAWSGLVVGDSHGMTKGSDLRIFSTPAFADPNGQVASEFDEDVVGRILHFEKVLPGQWNRIVVISGHSHGCTSPFRCGWCLMRCWTVVVASDALAPVVVSEPGESLVMP